MNSQRYFLISLLLLLLAGGTTCYACCMPTYSPRQYLTYRVFVKPDSAALADALSDRQRNLLEWQKYSSPSIPLSDIEEVIYEMPLKEFEKIHANPLRASHNKFIAWAARTDTEVLDLLLLAKRNEFVRAQRNSRWYYPSMKLDGPMTLEEIAEEALSKKDSPLYDRYLLQAVRALYTLGRYEQCAQLWYNAAAQLPEGSLMREMIHTYVRGAFARSGHYDEVMDYYIEHRDLESIIFCMNASGVESTKLNLLKTIYEADPGSTLVPELLQEMISKMEVYSDTDSREISELLVYSQMMGSKSKGAQRQLWYYTAAFLSDFRGNVSKASQLLREAESIKSSTLVDDSVRILRMIIDAKTLQYDSKYEKKLYADLRWLDSKIASNITEKVRSETRSMHTMQMGYSYYYWNDMMRRVVLGEICPRMIERGMSVRALQLANMADNRLPALVGRYEGSKYEQVSKDHYQLVSYDLPLRDYRYSDKLWNISDYSNNFFEAIDSLGVDVTEKYLDRVNNPRSDFDSFLNARGYTDRNYLHDIIGTQYLRNMRYPEAVRYLSMVAPSFASHLNVSLRFDPMTYDREPIEDYPGFRLDFAKKMRDLEADMRDAQDPLVKAEKTMLFAVGLRNSFDRCWSLTQYYRGYCYWTTHGEKRDWENEPLTVAALGRAEELLKQACRSVDELAAAEGPGTRAAEVAAEIHYELCHFVTVAMLYPQTSKGQLIKGSCDKLKDYFE